MECRKYREGQELRKKQQEGNARSEGVELERAR